MRYPGVGANRLRQRIRYAVLDQWLFWVQRETGTAEFDIIDVIEARPPTPEIRQHLQQLHLDAFAGLSTFEKIAARLDWARTNEWLRSKVPSIPRLKRGAFGEVLSGAMLRQFHRYTVPMEKLRFRFTPNQSPPFTDVVAFRLDDHKLTEVCFVESKLRTTGDTSAAKDGHDQLLADAKVAQPQILQFLAWHLDQHGSPLFEPLMEYLYDRSTVSEKDTFRLYLTWEQERWTETVLSNLEGEVQLEPFTVCVTRIKDLAKLVDDVYASIGAPQASHDD